MSPWFCSSMHGGFDPEKGVQKTSRIDLIWDRDLIEYAKYNTIKGYKKVFVVNK